ncbi:MAG TPA: hypothetical protein VHW23_03035 [Kofleriaceae bacterium]|nr:hypothetical protein [Kofleriaceae bacterium]
MTFTERVHMTPVQAAARRAISTGPESATSPAGARLDYFGGKVIQNVRVNQVLYGSGTYIPQLTSTSGATMASAYTQMVTSGVFDWLGEYNTSSPLQTIGRGSFAGSRAITPAASRNGSTISDANIQAEIAAQISAGVLPAPTDNQIYMLHFPAGKTLLAPDGTRSCVPAGFCAYHGTFQIGSQNVYYGVLPDFTTASCATGCGDGTTFQNQQSAASHELIEAVTDAEVGLATTIGPPLAWYDFDQARGINGEIGDLCNQQQATFVGTDGNTYTLQKEFSNQHNDCIAMPPPAPTVREHAMLFYNSAFTAGGAFALTQFGGDGSFINVSHGTGFSAGWDQVVSGGDHFVLFYNSSTGAIEVGRLDDSGVFTDLMSTTRCPGWTNVVITADNIVLFYNGGTPGCVGNNYSIGKLGTDGTFTDLSFGNLASGFTKLAVTASDIVTFYNGSNGTLDTALLDQDGALHNLGTFSGLSTGWTHMVAGLDGTMVFYNNVTGARTFGRVDASGVFTNIGTPGTFSAGYTSIVAGASDTALLFYRASDGFTAIGTLDVLGNYADVKQYSGVLSPGWTSAVAE